MSLAGGNEGPEPENFGGSQETGLKLISLGEEK